MIAKATVASILAAGAVMAAPASLQARQQCAITHETASFDDSNFLPALPLVNQVGKYQGLSIGGFSGANQEVLGLNVQPINVPSTPNVIVAGLLNQVLDSPPSIAVDNSTYYAFNLKELRFSCFLETVESAVNLGQTCTVTFTGFAPNGTQVATQAFDFTSDGLLAAQDFATATFPPSDWCNLGSVSIDVSTDNPLINTLGLNALAIDDIKYTLQSPTCAPPA